MLEVLLMSFSFFTLNHSKKQTSTRFFFWALAPKKGVTKRPTFAVPLKLLIWHMIVVLRSWDLHIQFEIGKPIWHQKNQATSSSAPSRPSRTSNSSTIWHKNCLISSFLKFYVNKNFQFPKPFISQFGSFLLYKCHISLLFNTYFFFFLTVRQFESPHPFGRPPWSLKPLGQAGARLQQRLGSGHLAALGGGSLHWGVLPSWQLLHEHIYI